MVPAVRGGSGTAGYTYPDQLDGRDSGVPDRTAAGPPFLQIGTEGGLLPNVAVVPPGPAGFEYNRRSITVLNVSNHALLLGAAERADAVVDFSAYSGKTLILYNDAPTPVPAFDSRIDYYTNDPDQVTTGGAPTTLPGYGPNTRTILQIVVDGNGPYAVPNTTPFTLSSMQGALPGIFSASNATTPKQAIIPEPTYPVASGGNALTATYGRISDNTITYTPLGATAPITINMEQKAIQELFTLDYGRMNATLGTELPLTNFLVQTTLPFGYAEWVTEIIQDSKDPTVLPQIWKLTHNGVDTHFIHFHLFNVQVINRIGWDGAVKPPDANELGWKDTVRMNPLEDIVVALQPVSQTASIPASRQHSLDGCDHAGWCLVACHVGHRPGDRQRDSRRRWCGNYQCQNQLWPGVRLALPYPGPRRKRYDAAHHLPGRTARTFRLHRGSGRSRQRAFDVDR